MSIIKGSYVVRNKQTKVVVGEFFNLDLVEHFNYAVYEAVPIQDYLVEVNRKIKVETATTPQ